MRCSLITFHFSNVSISTHVWMFLAQIHLIQIESDRWTRALPRNSYVVFHVVHATWFIRIFQAQNWWLQLFMWQITLMYDVEFIRMHFDVTWFNRMHLTQIEWHSLTIRMWISIKIYILLMCEQMNAAFVRAREKTNVQNVSVARQSINLYNIL